MKWAILRPDSTGPCIIPAELSAGSRERGGSESMGHTKSTRNQGKPWTPSAEKQLRQEARENTPTRVIDISDARRPVFAQRHRRSVLA